MIIRIDDSFIQLANRLNKPFLEGDKESLATTIDLNYNKIFSIISNLEKSKDYKPTVIELGNINNRYSFALNLYYYKDEMYDDIHSHYVDEIKEEDNGLRSIDEK